MAKNLEISLLLDFYGPILTEKQRDVVEQYYNDDLSLAEIAQNEGITRQGVRDSLKRAELQMLEMEERLGLVRRFRRISGVAAEIAAAAKEISDCNSRSNGPAFICENAEQIWQKASALKDI